MEGTGRGGEEGIRGPGQRGEESTGNMDGGEQRRRGMQVVRKPMRSMRFHR